ncbi:Multiple RNA-binding domain-containing protein 1 [Tulasnella sp. 425]|nr:Multiple RNA-binding domain-containing protein 1 [Tulasnella sp. 425]
MSYFPLPFLPKGDMSRLIIKNLPYSLNTSDKLRAHFNEVHLGTITDARIATKADGTFRGFGFLGYRTAEEALKAKEFFDQSFVESRKIQVELVDANKAREGSSIRPVKRPRLDSNVDQPTARSSFPSNPFIAPSPSIILPESTSSSKLKASDSRKEQQLAQFLELMGPRGGATNIRAWGNEEDFGRNEDQLKNQLQVREDKELLVEGSNPPPGTMSDMEWLKSRMKNASTMVIPEDSDEKIFQQSDEDDGEVAQDKLGGKLLRKADELPSLSTEEAELRRTTEHILSTGRLFLRNLTYSCSEEDLRSVFGNYGEIEQIHIVVDSKSHRSKGTAYIRYANPPDALAAYEAMDGKDLQGRLIHILPALDPPSARPLARNGAQADSSRNKSLKETAMDKRKENAGSEFNWAMMYMNSDAVVSSVADRMRIPKADILNAESGTTNPAVKLALAETHVIQETKSNNNNNTVILVKNIPYGTSTSDLQNLFGMHGEVKKLLIPPAGTMAVVEFEHVEEAKQAFKNVAYKRMKNTIVYLEWAPEGVFREGGRKGKERVMDSGVKPVTIAEQESAREGEADRKGGSAIQDEEVAGATLFVKNLNFNTTFDQLVAAFKGLPGFTFARINTRPDPKSVHGTGRLSMGYGFVGFASPEDAKRALKTMQGFVMDGHALLVSFAKRGADEERISEGQGGRLLLGATKSAKIIVRNVPFEASKKDLKELFGAHGTLKSIRLPKKFDSRSRGFAFLEFVSRREAENAMETLMHTHLLGRHLVLEWAKENEVMDVDELREKIRQSYVEEGKVLGGRKRKFMMEGEAGGRDTKDRAEGMM